MMDDIVNLCKQYGFVFPGSEIYDGFANTWDFGPVGVELKISSCVIWFWDYMIKKTRSQDVKKARSQEDKKTQRWSY